MSPPGGGRPDIQPDDPDTTEPSPDQRLTPSIALAGDTPRRIQFRRGVKGWRKPAGAVVVGRPSRWGNPYPVKKCRIEAHAQGLHWHVYDAAEPVGTYQTKTGAVAAAIELYRAAIARRRGDVPTVAEIRAGLAGRDLVCWCPLDGPCHADVLLAIANAT